jgi:ABC-type uncharacterized transport system ATPase subunit
LAQRLAPFKLLRVTLRNENGNGRAQGPLWVGELPPGVEITEQSSDRLTLRAGRNEAPAITAYLLQTLPVADLVVEDPPIEAVIDQVYQEGGV